jgi:hypothetical protein
MMKNATFSEEYLQWITQIDGDPSDKDLMKRFVDLKAAEIMLGEDEAKDDIRPE